MSVSISFYDMHNTKTLKRKKWSTTFALPSTFKKLSSLFFYFWRGSRVWSFFLSWSWRLQRKERRKCHKNEAAKSYSKQFTFFAVGDSGGASEQMDFDFSPLVHSGLVFCNEWHHLYSTTKAFRVYCTAFEKSPKMSHSFKDKTYSCFVFIFDSKFTLLDNFQILSKVILSCFLLQVSEFVLVFGNFLQRRLHTRKRENRLKIL